MKTTWIILLSILLVATTLSAQEAAPPMPELPPVVVVEIDGKAEPIRITDVSTEVRILGAVAETRTTLTLRNPHERAHEGDLYFPLPEGATVSGYALDIQGMMVDGVAVTRQKARQTFEREVRKGIDPGIVEWTRGNVFKTRIFPLPAKGSRTVRVSYVSRVLDTSEGAVYRLPLNFKEKVGSFALRVEVVKSGAAPKISENELSNFTFEKWSEGFLAETTMRDVALTEDISITLPRVAEIPVLVERDARGVVRFLVTERVEAPVTKRAPAPERLTILWDASGSRASCDQARELSFLRRYLTTALEMRPTIDVNVVTLRNRAESLKRIELSSARLDELLKNIAGIDYDGGTQMGSIAPFVSDTDLVLFFTDGISTFGVSRPDELAAPVYVINSSTVADASFMRSVARRTGGRYLDLKRITTENAVAAIGQAAFSFLSATTKGGKPAEMYPSMPGPVNGRFLLTGVLSSDKAEITLNFGVRQVTQSRTVTVSASDAVEGDVLRRFWAQEKLKELMTARKENEFEITRLGKKFGLVTPFTSLIVLETIEQYLEHEILPPPMLKKMREQYIEVVENRRREYEEVERGKLTRIVELWRARVAWWETKFEYPPNFKYRNKESKGDSTGMAAPGAATPSPNAGGAPEEESGEGEGGFGFSEGDDGGDDPSSEPGVLLSSWDPDTPYLKALKAAPKMSRFTVYMAAKEKFGGSPAFFLDCADFFMRKGDDALGLQVLSNIAEMELDDAQLLRILGHRLEQLGALDLSVLTFEEAKALRPEEPQSYRDLGLVLAKRGSREDLERAVELLYHVVLNEWERFDQIELLTLMELNQIIPKARAAGVTKIPVDPRLVKLLTPDIRIVMTWDADLTDMDLHVVEPSGEEAYYGHNRTTIGGLVSRDFTQGYGPEEYILRKAMHGRYIIKTHFFGSSAAKLIGAVTLHMDVYTNYGKPNEKVQSMTLRLTEKKESFVVGEIEF